MKQRIIDYIEQELLNGQVRIDENQDLLISGIVDSLGVMRLVAFIEQQAECRIPPEDVTLENFCNANVIASYIESLPKL